MRLFLAALALVAAILAAQPAVAQGDGVAVSPEIGALFGRPFSELVEARYGATLGLLKSEFPDDFALLDAQIGLIAKAGGNEREMLRLAFDRFTEIRRKYAEKLLYAPGIHHSVILGRLADFYDRVLKDEGPNVCGQFARDGTAVLFDLGLSEKYASFIDAQSFAYFDAVAKAAETPTFAGEVQQSDWSAVLQAMVAAGAPQSFVESIATGRSNDPQLCTALAALFRTSGLLDSPEGARTRADFAKNLTGY